MNYSELPVIENERIRLRPITDFDTDLIVSWRNKEDVKNKFYNTFNYMKNIDKIIEFNKNTNSYFIDTVEINKELLKEEGILEENIIDSKICTYCNSNIIHSYRKEGKQAGRNTALICLK